MALYSKVEYWNERYSRSRDQAPYEWYQDYTTLSHLLNPERLSGCSASTQRRNMINTDDDASVNTTAATNASTAKAYKCLHPSNCRVLVLGCGNSSLGAHMYEAGWRGGNFESDAGTRFVQVDFSPVVIDQMNERYNDNYYQSLFGPHTNSVPRMEFMCCDVTKTPLPFDAGSFDLILCKGLFDALLCSAGSVFNVRSMVKECVRLLNDDGGVLMVCTYGNPDNRQVFLEGEEGDLETYWSHVSVNQVPSRARNNKGNGHGPPKNDYVYLCQKKAGAWKEDMPVSVGQHNTALVGETDSSSGASQGEENAPTVSAATTGKDSGAALANMNQSVQDV